MDGYEHPTRNATPHQVYRLSWLAYVGPVLLFLVLCAGALALGWWTLHKAPSEQAYQIGLAVEHINQLHQALLRAEPAVDERT